VCITRCRAFKHFNSWRLQLCSPWKPDVSIFARLAPGNETILDYFCVPASKERRTQITVSPQTSPRVTFSSLLISVSSKTSRNGAEVSGRKRPTEASADAAAQKQSLYRRAAVPGAAYME
jgi:hypothetical protein